MYGHINWAKHILTYLSVTQFKKVSSEVDGNATEQVDDSSNDPFSHGLTTLKPGNRSHMQPKIWSRPSMFTNSNTNPDVIQMEGTRTHLNETYAY